MRGVCHGARTEGRGQLWELGFSIYHVGPGDWAQVIRLGSQYLCLLSHLSRVHPGFLCKNLFNQRGVEWEP